MRRAIILLPVFLLCAFAGVPEGVEELTLSNGIPVITRTLDNNSIEGVSIFLIGGSRALTAETQGLERFALECAVMGSSEYTGPEWRELMDLTQAEWSGSFNYDFTRYHLRCISEDMPELLYAFGTCLLDPELDQDAMEQVRGSMLNDLQETRSDPDGWIWFVANDAFMPGHTYRSLPDGTPETVGGFSEQDVVDMIDERIRAGNILITHAGPTAPEDLLPVLEAAFGDIPAGGTEYPGVASFEVSSDTVAIQHREVPTAYAVVKFNAPPRGHPDQPVFSAAMTVIDDMLWQVLRTDNALTYATYGGSTANYEENWGYMYVSSPSPVAACSLMAGVMTEAISGSMDQIAVTAAVERLRTYDAMSAADKGTQCWLMGSYQISTGDWRNAFTMFDAISGLTPEEVTSVLDEWVGQGGWGIIADTTIVPAEFLGPWPLRQEDQ